MRTTTLVLAGRYQLEDRIAAGGAGEVWRGRDTVLARPVAVKLLRPEYVEHPDALARFQAEARHAAALSHPGIAQVYDYGEDRQPFLVMELVEGPSLAGVLARGPLDTWHALDVAAQTATALAAAHAAGLVHRDIKPANLLIAPGGQVKITDFGIAHAAGSAPVTRAGMLIGTPAYLAPERAAGDPATAASDLYSLGIVCYECLAGAPPFTGAAVEVAVAHQHGHLPALPAQVPVEVAALVASLTARDAAGRPASAADAAAWAARLRDAQAPGPADIYTVRGGALPDLGGPLPATLVGAPSRVLADGAASNPASYRPPLRTGTRRRALALAAGVTVIIVALATWLLAGGAGTAHPGRQAGLAPASSAPAGPHPADVKEGALIGQPVSVVRQQLRQLGLRVQVTWRISGHQQPGTVISVQPAGSLRAGTPVTITGAMAPPGHSGGHGGHGDHGGGNDQGNGHGGGQGD